MKRNLIALALGLALIGSTARAADKKPNILVIFGDDIGTWNVSAYSLGMMGVFVLSVSFTGWPTR